MSNRLQIVSRTYLLLSGIVLLGCCAVVHATSVIEVSVEEMLQGSVLVFEGEVTAVDIYDLGNGGVQTRVTFEIVDVIKGEIEGTEITLGFLGGKLTDRQLLVTDMHIPELGERGIYFAEAPRRNLVNPLYGWSQGHLKLKRDVSGTDRVMTRAGRSVTGMHRSEVRRSNRLSNGVARGLQTDSREASSMSIDKREFKRQLREMRQQ